MKVKKISIIIIIIATMALIFLSGQVYAEEEVPTVDQLIETSDTFIESGQDTDKVLLDSETAEIILRIGNALSSVAIVVIIVSLLVVAIKYMTSPPSEMAKLKGKLVGLIVATIVILMAFTIWKISVQFFGIENLGGGAPKKASNDIDTSQQGSGNQTPTDKNVDIDEEEGEFIVLPDPLDETVPEVEEEEKIEDLGSDEDITTLMITKNPIYMIVGDTTLIYPSVKPLQSQGQMLQWTSEDTSVAQVVNGQVYAAGAGSTTIKVRSKNGKEAVTRVKVFEKEEGRLAVSIKFDQESYVIKIGERIQLNPVIEPVNAINRALTFTSNKTSVATVDKNGIVRGIKGGTAWITVKTDNGISDKVKVNVVLDTTEIPIKGMKFLSETFKVCVGDTVSLDYETNPITANSKIKWTSSNNNVATVENGVVTGKAVGKVTIKAKSLFNNMRSDEVLVKKTCTVQVLPAGSDTSINPKTIKLDKTKEILYIGDVVQLIETITPSNASNVDINWSSGNDSIATVEDGRVTAMAEGETTITATTPNGLSAKYQVTVKKKIDDLQLEDTYSYSSSSLEIQQGILKYNGAECYVNKIWMKSPGNQIKKVTGKYSSQGNRNLASRKQNFAKNTSTSNLISKINGLNPFIAINCEYADTDKKGVNGMDFVSVQNGKTVIERHEYSPSQPTETGFSVNNAGFVTPYFDAWREEIWKGDPGTTFAASNFPKDSIIVKDGKAYIGGSSNQQAKSVFAMIDSNTCLILTVKKGGSSGGLSLAEIKDLCISMNCRWAIAMYGSSQTTLYSKTKESDSLQNLYGGSKDLYSMLYITEYSSSNLTSAYSGDRLDADYEPYYSPYLNFVGKNPLSNKINPKFGDTLVKTAKALGATKKNPLVINSGFRSTEWQRYGWLSSYAKKKEYRLNWKGSLTRLSSGKSIKAMPGKSKHQKGYAIDIPYTGIAAKIRSLSASGGLRKYGIFQPMDWEPWHYELIR